MRHTFYFYWITISGNAYTMTCCSQMSHSVLFFPDKSESNSRFMERWKHWLAWAPNLSHKPDRSADDSRRLCRLRYYAPRAGISERKRTVRVQARSEIERLVCAMQSDFQSRYIRSQKALSLELCALDVINRNGLIAVNLQVHPCTPMRRALHFEEVFF